ncbi:DUF6767 domain-containing protein [Brachybacterium nesterenkovii]|uniref:Uncharacterized protein n=1 Tax=Brachybacterium nesterenkovii TaxID=47847 RepID=A0A1X6X0U8_9MICO|nr:DUF6767 domain-containing protein [Brachybacterium nesterenkovii]SLM91973.1 hypothetical protein FM110_07350 [Brachybacterium nesterenkovii]
MEARRPRSCSADCPTVRLVMEDPDLREMLHEKRMAAKQAS